MAAVVAAKQKWRVGKMMPVLYREGAIAFEECPAKTLKAQAACSGRPESIILAIPVAHLRQDIKQMRNLND
jgi:hypothetical protein